MGRATHPTQRQRRLNALFGALPATACRPFEWLMRAAFIGLLCCAPLHAAEPPLHELCRLVDERLELMKAVALYKRAHQLPVEDLKREQAIIDRVASDAGQLGLDPTTTQAFFQAQMEAGKQLQHGWLQQWQQQPPQGLEVVDLAKEIRPRLDQINSRMLVALKAALPTLVETDLYTAHQAQFNQQVDAELLGDTGRQALLTTLLAVRAASAAIPPYSRLDQVIARGYLRIGTTGDYPPFSEWRQADNGLAGIDVELARELAKSLGVEARFVQTSWPQLSSDLLANRYDLAMSGVSITLARQQIGLFSQRYHLGGKTPIARCSERERFSSLERIDQPGIKVIVNPGGTNQQFAESNLKRAALIHHPDNRTIFDEIIQGRANVMITDDIEVTLQSRKHPELCPTMPGSTLNKSAKGILLPRDPILKAYIDAWLEQMRLDGKIDRLFIEHLGSAPLTVH